VLPATRAYLVSQGIASNRISIDGRGASEPVAANTSPENRAKNRRVEIFVKEPQPQPQHNHNNSDNKNCRSTKNSNNIFNNRHINP
jgi:hypothetical protein